VAAENVDIAETLHTIAQEQDMTQASAMLRARQLMGQQEHGADNWRMPWHDPDMETLEELADVVVYQAHAGERTGDPACCNAAAAMSRLDQFARSLQATDEHHLVFVCGPYRASDAAREQWPGETDFEIVSRHIRRARKMKAAIMRRGHSTYCPHIESALMDYTDPAIPDGAHLNNCRRVLQHCTALMLLPGWEESNGALNERILAGRAGIPIYDDILQLPVRWAGVWAQWHERMDGLERKEAG